MLNYIFTIFSHTFSVNFLLQQNSLRRKNTALTSYQVFLIIIFFWGGGNLFEAECFLPSGWALIQGELVIAQGWCLFK